MPHLLFCSVFVLFLWWNSILTKIWVFFFDLRADLHPVSLKNNLRIILGSKSENFKNIEGQGKIRYAYKKVCNYEFGTVKTTQ